MLIINLTARRLTEDQQQAGMIDLPLDIREILRALLQFDELPSREQVVGSPGR